MGRLGAMFSIFPSWDDGCTVGQRLTNHPKHEIMMLFHTNAVQRQLAISAGSCTSTGWVPSPPRDLSRVMEPWAEY